MARSRFCGAIEMGGWLRLRVDVIKDRMSKYGIKNPIFEPSPILPHQVGYSKAQAYAILGTAPLQGHISGVVDIPNVCATLWLPTDIFEFDVTPSAVGPSAVTSIFQPRQIRGHWGSSAGS
jgi:formamidase